MNSKQAKQLRRQIKYHPKQEREYETNELNGVTELAAHDRRYMYKQLKKEKGDQ